MFAFDGNIRDGFPIEQEYVIWYASFHFIFFISSEKSVYIKEFIRLQAIRYRRKQSDLSIWMNEKKETRLNMYMKSEWKTNYSIKSIVNIYKAVFTNQNVVNRVHYRSSRLKCDKIVSLSFSICYRVPEAVLHVYIWCLHAKLSMCTYVGQFSLVFFYLCCFCFFLFLFCIFAFFILQAFIVFTFFFISTNACWVEMIFLHIFCFRFI